MLWTQFTSWLPVRTINFGPFKYEHSKTVMVNTLQELYRFFSRPQEVLSANNLVDITSHLVFFVSRKTLFAYYKHVCWALHFHCFLRTQVLMLMPSFPVVSRTICAPQIREYQTSSVHHFCDYFCLVQHCRQNSRHTVGIHGISRVTTLARLRSTNLLRLQLRR